jgi:hypothetical protein
MSTSYIFHLQKNDLLPSLSVQLFASRATRTPLSLVGASVDFVLTQINDDSSLTELVNASATVSDAANGLVQYDWAPGNTDTVGSHLGRFVVTHSGGEQETFPPDGYIEVRIGGLE